jgi:WD repeat-containing protein 61
LAFAPDNKTLYTACDDGHCHAYDAANKSLLDALPGHKGWVLGVACSKDGFGVATCGADAAVKLWDVRSTTQAEKCAQTASAQTEAVWGVAFSPSDDKLASASDDKSVAVYQYVP